MKRNTEIKLKVVEWMPEDNLVILQTPTKTFSLASEEFLKFIESAQTTRVKQFEKKLFTKADFYKKLISLDVSEKDAKDWMEVRKQRRGVFTENVIENILTECQKHQFAFPEAIKASAKYGWQGFEYQWFLNKQNNGSTNNQNTINGSYSHKKAGDKVSGIAGIVAGIGYQEFTSDS